QAADLGPEAVDQPVALAEHLLQPLGLGAPVGAGEGVDDGDRRRGVGGAVGRAPTEQDAEGESGDQEEGTHCAGSPRSARMPDATEAARSWRYAGSVSRSRSAGCVKNPSSRSTAGARVARRT